jgi:hypothetical protein
MRRQELADVVQRIGGVTKAAAAGDITTATTYKVLKDGFVRSGRTVVLWSEKIHPTDPRARWALARQLAGLD